MNIQFGLNIVTLVMCIITLTMATAALMPQIKMGLVILRDGLLWSILLGIVCFVGFIGWTRLHEVRLERSQRESLDDLQNFQAPDVAPSSLKGPSTNLSFTNTSSRRVLPYVDAGAPSSSATSHVVAANLDDMPSLMEYSSRVASRRPDNGSRPRESISNQRIRPNRSTLHGVPQSNPVIERWSNSRRQLQPVYYEGRYQARR
jgi:hypothetical protein